MFRNLKITNYKAPIIVCGMHRSGTSLISRILDEAGVFMGNDLEVNHESLSFMFLNEYLLNLAHSFWDQIEGAKYFFSDQNAIKQAKEIVLKKVNETEFNKKYFGKVNPNTKTIGWKDPRNTITASIWQQIFPNAKFIFIYRNSIDVAASLWVRETKQDFDITVPAYSSRCLSLDSSLKLWEDYNNFFFSNEELLNSPNLKTIKYEDLLENPSETIEDLSSFLNLNISTDIINKLDKSKAYKFKDNKDLVSFYNKIKASQLMQQLGYNNLTNG